MKHCSPNKDGLNKRHLKRWFKTFSQAPVAQKDFIERKLQKQYEVRTENSEPGPIQEGTMSTPNV